MGRHLGKQIQGFALWLALASFAAGCAQLLEDCGGRPDLNYESLAKNRQLFEAASGPRADLVLPNPMDVTSSLQSFAGANDLEPYSSAVPLQGVTSGTTLDNSIFRVRQTTVNDAAIQSTGGYFHYQVQDYRYSAAMAYHAISTSFDWFTRLGYSLLTDRQLVVLVRSPENYQGEFNAFYEHNRFSTTSPRLIRMIGAGNYPTGADLHMSKHEVHHYLFEALTANRGVDRSTERGNRYAGAAALHEFAGDYGALTGGRQAFIGRWIARNFSDVPTGAPLRSAVDAPNNKFDYRKAATNTMDTKAPEKYTIAEGILRSVWEFRTEIEKEQTTTYGPIVSDDIVFGALSLLPRDASIPQFAANVLQADKELYCGLHEKSITKAFDSRGFLQRPPELTEPLQFAVSPFGLSVDGSGEPEIGPPTPGYEVGFEFVVKNPNAAMAYDVVIEVTSNDQYWIESTYRQGLGHIDAGKKVTVAFSNQSPQPSPLSHAIYGFIDQRRPSANGLSYTITVRAQNGPPATKTGTLQ